MNPTADPPAPVPCPKCGGIRAGVGFTCALCQPAVADLASRLEKRADQFWADGNGDVVMSRELRDWAEELKEIVEAPCDCRPDAPAEPLCSCWAGGREVTGSSSERRQCAVHGYKAPPADRGRGETNETSRDRLAFLSLLPEWTSSQVLELARCVRPILAERDAATAEVERLREESKEPWRIAALHGTERDAAVRRADRAEKEAAEYKEELRLTLQVTMASLMRQRDQANGRAERTEAERDKLTVFKKWVHEYLDGVSVPHHPPGTHGAAGCRIGDRMDWLMKQLSDARADVAALVPAAKKAISSFGRDEPCTEMCPSTCEYAILRAARAVLDRTSKEPPR